MIPSLSVVQTLPSRRRNDAPALSSPPNPTEPSTSPSTNHLKPTGTSTQPPAEVGHDAVDDRGAHERLADRDLVTPLPPAAEQVRDRRREHVVGVHQPGPRHDDAMAVRVGVVAERQVEPVAQLHEAGHRVRARRVHPDLAVPVERHEPERRVDGVVGDREVEPVALADHAPVRDGGTAHRIHPDPQPGVRDRGHVDDRVQVVDVAGRGSRTRSPGPGRARTAGAGRRRGRRSRSPRGSGSPRPGSSASRRCPPGRRWAGCT